MSWAYHILLNLVADQKPASLIIAFHCRLEESWIEIAARFHSDDHVLFQDPTHETHQEIASAIHHSSASRAVLSDPQDVYQNPRSNICNSFNCRGCLLQMDPSRILLQGV